jgi:Zn-dependent protease with chaperone function
MRLRRALTHVPEPRMPRWLSLLSTLLLFACFIVATALSDALWVAVVGVLLVSAGVGLAPVAWAAWQRKRTHPAVAQR